MEENSRAASPSTSEGAEAVPRPPEAASPPSPAPEATASASSKTASGGGPGGDATLGLYKKGYILQTTLGNGAYAKVKLAHSVTMNKKVAIKIVDKKKAPHDVLTKFLPREIEALQALQGHDNIIGLYDVIPTPDKLFLVMELAENGDLLDYINSKKRLSERTARSFFRDMVSAIIFTHRKDFVHRDIKCENLLLDANYKLKISDFGFARSNEDSKMLETYCGSFAYAAPEIIRGEPYNGKKSDVWSLGVVLYAMVCGKLPFKDGDFRSLLRQIANGISFHGDVTDNCRDLILKILVLSPSERISVQNILAHIWMKEDPEDN
jgi:serine kinase